MVSVRIVLTSVLLAPALVGAQLVPQTGDIAANTFAIGTQFAARVAANPNTGTFVVVWSTESQDGDNDGVFAQRFGSDGSALGSEFQVNSFTASSQSSPVVGVDPQSGAFVVAWQSIGQEDGTGESGVFAQRFASDGTPAGNEFQVNSYTTGSQAFPAVGVDPASGAFVVAWESFYQDGNSDGVFAQRFSSDGTAAGSEFQVNTYTDSTESDSSVSVGAGGFVVAWRGWGGVSAQRFASDGSPTGTEFLVNTYTAAFFQDEPAVGVDPTSGAFVVAWRVWEQDGSRDGVFAQRFTSDGSAAGTEFQVNSYTSGDQYSPDVAIDPVSGAFVVSWQSDGQDGNGDGLFAQRFDSNGDATGSEFRVNEFGYFDQRYPSISARGDGAFVVAWEDGSGQDGCIGYATGVFGQRFDSSGSALGTEFHVNTYVHFEQESPVVGVSSAGDFVVAWHSRREDGYRYGVFAQRFTSSGSPAGSEFQVNSYTSSEQRDPSVGVHPSSGEFVIVWHSGGGRDGEFDGVFAQRFGSDGIAVGSEFLVNSSTVSSQRLAEVGIDTASGAFVVAWESAGQDGSFESVFAQRFGSSGSTAGSEFMVNSFTDSSQRNQAVGVDAGSGAFVIAWDSYGQDGSEQGVFAQRFNADGSAAGGELQINTNAGGSQEKPALGVDPITGAFVVAWQGAYSQDGSSRGVFAQRFESDGSALGGEFQVNSYTEYNQNDPAVGVDPTSGAFVVAWPSVNQDGDGYGVFAQRFGSDGSALGSEFQVNSYTTDTQRNPAVGMNPQGDGFVVVWQSLGQEGCTSNTGFGAIVRLFGEATPTATSTATSTQSPTATPTLTPGTSAVCPASPAMGCTVPTKGKLIVKDNADNTKDKLVWKFGKGPQLTQADFGNPVTTNGYAFCVYDDGTLKIDLTIPAGTPWEDLSTKGYQYKDSLGTNDGVTKVKLIGGDAGKSKLQLKGKGAGLGMPPAATGSQLFSATTSVVAQLHGNGDCWETTFTTGHTHKVNSYKGKF